MKENTLMNLLPAARRFAWIFACIVLVFFACKKSDSTSSTTGGGTLDCTATPIVLTATVGRPTNGLPNGTINASATGGSGAFTYSLDGGVYQNSGLFSGLDVGIYNVTARTTNGCTATIRVAVQAAPSPCIGANINVSVAATSPTGGQANGTLTVTASGGNGILTYSRDGGTTYQTSNTFSGLAAGTYNIVVKDGNGCTATSVINLN